MANFTSSSNSAMAGRRSSTKHEKIFPKNQICYRNKKPWYQWRHKICICQTLIILRYRKPKLAKENIAYMWISNWDIFLYSYFDDLCFPSTPVSSLLVSWSKFKGLFSFSLFVLSINFGRRRIGFLSWRFSNFYSWR